MILSNNFKKRSDFMKEAKETKMSKKELIRRYSLFVLSLFISALGVAITKKGELGVSPIQCQQLKKSCDSYPV